MVSNPALSVEAAGAGTGVAALLVHTGQVVGALRVDETLGPTAHIRIANMLGNALAGPGAIALRTLGIGATRRGVAWVHHFRWACNGCIRKNE